VLKKRIIQGLWILAGIGVIVLLGAAMQQKNHKVCEKIEVHITGAEKHVFIDEDDIKEMLNSISPVAGKDIASLNLRIMEEQLEKNAWVKNAELFFDNHRILMVNIEERQPIARVFTVQGSSFYLDTAGVRLPLSDNLSARVPVFTNFPSDKKVMAHSDSMLMKDVVKLGSFIMADSFWMAQTAQINITTQGHFEMFPVIGDHTVALGNADDLEGKFNRLFTFYKQAWLQNGINKYEKLDVQFNNQIVAVRKGTAQAVVDSAKARQAVLELMNTSQIDTAQHITTAAVNRMANNRDTARTRTVTTAPRTTVQQNNNAARPANNTRPQQQRPQPAQPQTNRPRAVMGNHN
jgi:cell division protein FtsQ